MIETARQNILQLLLQVNRLFAVSLDSRQTFEDVIHFLVPAFADYGVIHLLQPDGNIEPVAIAHVEPSHFDVLCEIVRRFPPDPRYDTPTARVLKSHKAEMVSHVTDVAAPSMSRVPEQAQLNRILNPHSYIVMPLIARDRLLGILTMAMSVSERYYDQPDLDVIELVAQTVALAIDNMQLHQQAQEEITRRAQAETALRQSEERFRIAQELSLDAFTTLESVRDANGNIIDFRWTYVNPEAGRILKHAPETLIGKQLLQVLPANHENIDLFNYYVHVVESGTPHDREMPYWADGISGWFRNMAVKLGDGVAVFFSDITERKHAIERIVALQEITAALSEAITPKQVADVVIERTAPLVNASHASIILLGEDKRTLKFLKSAPSTNELAMRYQQFNMDKPSLVVDSVRNGETIWIESQEEYIRRYPHYKHNIREIHEFQSAIAFPLRVLDRIIGGIAFSFSEPNALPDSERRFLSTIAHYCAQAMERAQLYEGERQSRKIAEATARRLERLQAVTAALAQAATPAQVFDAILTAGITAVDAKAGSVMLVENDTMLEVVASVGYSPDLINAWKRFPADQPATPIVEAICIQQPIWLQSPEERRERFAIDELGLPTSTVYEAWAALPLVVDGKPIGGIGLSFATARVFDEDERNFMEVLAGQCSQALERARLYEAEQQARKDAQAANDMKMRFLGMVSHELRTPLTSIKGFTSTMLADDVTFDEDTKKEFIAIIDEEADKLTDLIEQLLNLTRLQSGTLPIQPELQPFDIVLNVARVQLETLTRDHPLHLEMPKSLPLVRIDSHRIAQVLVNLVGNAAKYSPAGTPIRIAAHASADYVQVDVSDEGIGIPEEARDRVFEVFQQVERRRASMIKGAGLGLAICKGLIDAHGGTIWIQDRDEPGTTISFRLPLAEA